VAVTRSADFTVGAARTIMSGKGIGQWWDVDRMSRRIAVTVPVTQAGVRMVVSQHWLESFTRKVARPGSAK